MPAAGPPTPESSCPRFGPRCNPAAQSRPEGPSLEYRPHARLDGPPAHAPDPGGDGLSGDCHLDPGGPHDRRGLGPAPVRVHRVRRRPAGRGDRHLPVGAVGPEPGPGLAARARPDRVRDGLYPRVRRAAVLPGRRGGRQRPAGRRPVQPAGPGRPNCDGQCERQHAGVRARGRLPRPAGRAVAGGRRHPRRPRPVPGRAAPLPRPAGPADAPVGPV